MGNRGAKSSLRNAIVFLNISADQIELNNDEFWEQIWAEDQNTAADIIKSIRVEEIRMLRDGSSGNFAALTYKMVEKLYLSTGTLCNTHSQQTAVMNSVRILIRLMPCIFEDDEWQSFFLDNELDESKSQSISALKYPDKRKKIKNFSHYVPGGGGSGTLDQYHANNSDSSDKRKPEICSGKESIAPIIHFDEVYELEPVESIDKSSNKSISVSTKTLADRTLIKRLIDSVCDLLFCPEFTVPARIYLSNIADAPPEDLRSLATVDYVWEPGVGFESSANSTTAYDKSRAELLRLLLACFSITLHRTPEEVSQRNNPWIDVFTSSLNRHTLPIFTSLLNTIFSYRPGKLSLANLIFEDKREELVEVCSQLMNGTLDYSSEDNMFVDYLQRIHRDEDLSFLVEGFSRLLSSGLDQNYLISSSKRVNFDIELLLLLWRISNANRKFLVHLLKSNATLDILVPLLYHINENFQDTTKTAKIHLSIFNLLLLSGERNFGVRLNDNYSANILTNLPAFSGSYADLLIIVFHKLILYGENVYQLFNYLLTILANVSPYLKSLTILSCKCLVQLFEIFSSPYVVFTEPNYHLVVLLLVETFNNLIQYQLATNTNLVCILLAKRAAFKDLAGLATTKKGIGRVLKKLSKQKQHIQSATSYNCGIKIDKRGKRSVECDSTNAVLTSDTSQSTENTSVGVALVSSPSVCQVTYPTFPLDTHIIQKPSTVSSKSNKAEEVHLSDTSVFLQVNSRPEDDSNISRSSTSISSSPSQTTWKPTPDRVLAWKKSLPLQTTIRMIEVLAPQLDALGFPNMTQEEQLAVTVKLLDSGTLVGLLPVPHQILTRKFQACDQMNLWFTTCTWATLYIRNSTWLVNSIKLIKPLSPESL